MYSEDLFGETPPVPTIPGLFYRENYISAEEETALIAAIDATPWSNALRRRTQHYGWRYDYAARSVYAHDRLGVLPGWLDRLAWRLMRDGLFATVPDQAIVNEYLPGQGIGAHIDCQPCFGPVIASLSLLSGVPMDFRRGVDCAALWLAPRSVLVLSGAAREEWTHAIAAHQQDMVLGVRRQRERRLSITFRTVVLTPVSDV